MNNSLIGFCVSLVALSIGLSAHADGDDFHRRHQNNQPFSLSYVQNSLTQSKISFGPWTLHQSGYLNYDASGIVPTTAGPPYVGECTPYVDFCNAKGKFVKNKGASLTQQGNRVKISCCDEAC